MLLQRQQHQSNYAYLKCMQVWTGDETPLQYTMLLALYICELGLFTCTFIFCSLHAGMADPNTDLVIHRQSGSQMGLQLDPVHRGMHSTGCIVRTHIPHPQSQCR